MPGWTLELIMISMMMKNNANNASVDKNHHKYEYAMKASSKCL